MSRAAQPVKLKVYDISKGLAATLSPMLLGKSIGGIWHTGILVYGLEYFYGGGILHMPPDELEAAYEMSPVREVDLGETTMSKEEFHRKLAEMHPRFTEQTYHLINWNCNHFTDECAKALLGGKGIPREYVHQHEELLDTPFGKSILKWLEQAHRAMQEGMSHANERSLFTAGLDNPHLVNNPSSGGSKGGGRKS